MVEDPAINAALAALTEQLAALEAVIADLAAAPAPDAGQAKAIVDLVGELAELRVAIEQLPVPNDAAITALLLDLSEQLAAFARAEAERHCAADRQWLATIEALTEQQAALEAKVDAAVVGQDNARTLEALAALGAQLAVIEQMFGDLGPPPVDAELHEAVQFLGEELANLRQGQVELVAGIAGLVDADPVVLAALAGLEARLSDLETLVAATADAAPDLQAPLGELQENVAELTTALAALSEQIAAQPGVDEDLVLALTDIAQRQSAIKAALTLADPTEALATLVARLEALEQRVIAALEPNAGRLDPIQQAVAALQEAQAAADIDLAISALAAQLAAIKDTVAEFADRSPNLEFAIVLAGLDDRLAGLEQAVGALALSPVPAPIETALNLLSERLDGLIAEQGMLAAAIAGAKPVGAGADIVAVLLAFDQTAADIRADLAVLIDAGLVAAAQIATLEDRQAAIEARLAELAIALVEGAAGEAEFVMSAIELLVAELGTLRGQLDRRAADDAELAAILADRLAELDDHVAALAMLSPGLDQGLANIDTELARLRGQIAALEDDPALAAIFAELSGRQSALEAAIAALIGNDEGIAAELFGVRRELSELQAMLGRLGEADPAVEPLMVGLGEQMAGIEAGLEQLRGQIDQMGYDPAIAEIVAMLAELSGRQSAVEAAIIALPVGDDERIIAELADLMQNLADLQAMIGRMAEADPGAALEPLMIDLGEQMAGIEAHLVGLAEQPDPEVQALIAALTVTQQAILAELQLLTELIELLATIDGEPAAAAPTDNSSHLDGAAELPPPGFGEQLMLRLYEIVGGLKRGLNGE